MNRLQYFALIVCLFFTLNLCAQVVPGYQGKRFFVELGGTFGPALSAPTVGNKSLGDGNLGAFNTRWQYGINYTLSRRVSARVERLHFATAYNGYNNFQNQSFSTFNKLNVRSTSVGIDIVKVRVNKWGLAPIGASFGLHYGYGNADQELRISEYDEDRFSENFVNTAEEELVLEEVNFNYIGCKFMARRIITKHLLLTSGLDLNLTLNAQLSNADADEGITETNIINIDERLRNHYSFHFQISLGYLIF